jgi:hypothetical protein
MPRPAVIQWRKTASTQARQLNMNNAARAPPWRSPKAMLLVQLIFCRSVLSRRSVFTNASRDSSLQRFRRSVIVVLSAGVFMARVAPHASTTNLPIPMRHGRGESLRVKASHLAPRCSHRRWREMRIPFTTARCSLDRSGRSVRRTC